MKCTRKLVLLKKSAASPGTAPRLLTSASRWRDGRHGNPCRYWVGGLPGQHQAGCKRLQHQHVELPRIHQHLEQEGEIANPQVGRLAFDFQRMWLVHKRGNRKVQPWLTQGFEDVLQSCDSHTSPAVLPPPQHVPAPNLMTSSSGAPLSSSSGSQVQPSLDTVPATMGPRPATLTAPRSRVKASRLALGSDTISTVSCPRLMAEGFGSRACTGSGCGCNAARHLLRRPEVAGSVPIILPPQGR